MSTIQLEAQVATEELLRALERLPDGALDAVLARALFIRAGRTAPHLEAAEVVLLERINEAIPTGLQHHLDSLVARRDARTLTEPEHDELLELTDEIENLEARRVEALGDLARVRGTTLGALMGDLSATG